MYRRILFVWLTLFAIIRPITAQNMCPLPFDGWADRAEWPVNMLQLGIQFYNQDELQTLLTSPPAGDASLILARQLITAKLNIANGSDPLPVGDVLIEADTLLAEFDTRLPFAVAIRDDSGQAMVVASGTLDVYNQGLLTGSCEGTTPENITPIVSTPEPTTVVQAPTLLPTAEPTSTSQATATHTPAPITGYIPEIKPQMQYESTTYYRLAHLAEDVGSVDVTIDGNMSDLTGLAFEQVSVWSTLPAGRHSITVMKDGQTIATADLSLGGGQWTTIAVVPVPNSDAFTLATMQGDHSDVLPGTGRVLFVNALDVDTAISLNRNDIPFITQLAPLGKDDFIQSWSVVNMDSSVYDFTVIETFNPQITIDAFPSTLLVDTNTYLLAAVGADNPRVLLHGTRRAETEVARGRLQAPGTLAQAVNSRSILAPFAEAVEIAGMTDVLQKSEALTILAPADYVMDDLVARYRNDPETLERILRAHIFETDLKSYGLFRAGTVTGLAGNNINITQNQSHGFANGNQIIDVNIPAMNGTIHVINGTLANN